GLGLVAALAVAVGWLLERLAHRASVLLWRGARTAGNDGLPRLTPGPLRLFLACFLASKLLHALDLGPDVASFLGSLLTCGLILALAWLLLRLLRRGTGLVERYYTRRLDDPGQARTVQTQVLVIRAVLRFLVVIAAAALMLMQFAVAWSVGLSLLA